MGTDFPLPCELYADKRGEMTSCASVIYDTASQKKREIGAGDHCQRLVCERKVIPLKLGDYDASNDIKFWKIITWSIARHL